MMLTTKIIEMNKYGKIIIKYNSKLYDFLVDTNRNSIILEKWQKDLKLRIDINKLRYVHQIGENDFIIEKEENIKENIFQHVGVIDDILFTKFYQKHRVNTYKKINILDNIYVLSLGKGKYLIYNSKNRKTRIINNSLFEIGKLENEKIVIKVIQKIKYKNLRDTLYFAIDPNSLEYIGKMYSCLQNKGIDIYKNSQIPSAIKDNYDSRLLLTYSNRIYKPMINLYEKNSNSCQKIYK